MLIGKLKAANRKNQFRYIVLKNMYRDSMVIVLFLLWISRTHICLNWMKVRKKRSQAESLRKHSILSLPNPSR